MKSRASIAILVVILAGFAFGLFKLFQLRFEAGDIYPAYSSLRADPLGTMALYESLELLPGLAVQRDFSANNRLPAGKDTAYLHLATHSYEWALVPTEVFREVESFVMSGGRFVITFYPESTTPFRFLSGTAPATAPAKSSPKGQKKKKPASDEDEDEFGPRVSLQERWGVELAHAKLQTDDGESYQSVLVENVSDLPLPAEMDWHSGLVFTNLKWSWQTIYRRDKGPVMVQKQFGAGTIVMATDSYFLSNEALREESQPDLLLWLIGPAKRILFDEAHHGIVDNPGVAGLLRKYRLHGVVAALLLLTGLFIWKNSMSFVPASAAKLPPGYVAGKEAADGFINLLRRNVAPRELLGLCFSEWTKAMLQGRGHLIARVDRAQSLLETENARANRDRDPVRTYIEICHALKGEASDRRTAEQPAAEVGTQTLEHEHRNT